MGLLFTLAKKSQRFLPLRFRRLQPRAVVDLGKFVDLPAGYHPTNPSIVSYDERFLVCVRGVNYVLEKPGSLKPRFTAGTEYDTLNRFFLLDGNLSAAHSLPGLDRAFAGVEDVKLFSAEGVFYGVGSKIWKDGPSENSCRIVLGRIAPDLSGAELRSIPSPFGRSQEKNWVPLVRDGSIHFIYSVSPLLIFRLHPESGELSPVPEPCAGTVPQALPFLISGSSPAVPVRSAYVLIAHRRKVQLPTLRKIYLSRAYALQPDFTAAKGGPYFSIAHPAIQFVNGFASTEDSIYLSYGVEDHDARLAVFDRNDFLRRVAVQV